MTLLRPPGVYRAAADTELLIDVMRRGGFAIGREVLDLGTGSGVLALAAARAGAATVTAVDVSLRSVAATWLNARLHGARVAVRRGDLFAPVVGRRFGLVVANPPYVPAATDRLPRHRMERCWDAGADGRALLDRICADVPHVLTPGGDVLLVQSGVCDTDLTLESLGRAGLVPQVLAKATVPFGPVMRARADLRASRGLISAGQREDELVVVGAHRD